jgi:hypothetical protein
MAFIINMQEYGNVLNSFSDYLIYDDRKGRVLHTKYLNRGQFLEMWRFHFNRLRPDFSEMEYMNFLVAQRGVRGLVACLRNQSLNELKREITIHPSSFLEKNTDLVLSHMNYLAPSMAAMVIPKTLSWVDTTKNFIYFQKVLAKLEGYGLLYPEFHYNWTNEQKVVYEEQLYQYFKSLLTKN